MENLLIVSKIVLGISVFYVWIFRHYNVTKEFKQFGLSDLTRNFVGALKVALATLIIASIWYTSLAHIPSLLMGLFMVSAQYFHYTIRNPFIKHLPSLVLLILSAFIAFGSIL